jgi:DNA invertase Pin-like site-specific DNA recombinase
MGGDSQRRQLAYAQELCQRHGWRLDDSLTLRDLGVSAFRGANARGGELALFLDAIRSGRVTTGSVLIIENLDRLSRDNLDPAHELFKSILRAGVTIATAKPERVYPPESVNDLLGTFEAIMHLHLAHEESAKKSVRVRQAWTQKRKSASAKPMTAKCPEWLRLTPDGFQVIEERAAAVRRIFALSREGVGARVITAELMREGHKPFGRSGQWNMSYVRKILVWRAVFGECQLYILRDGKRVPDGDPIPNYYPAVVSEVDFYAAQAGLRGRRTQRGRSGTEVANLFTELAHCANDGYSMVLKRPTGGEQRYLYLMSSAYRFGQKTAPAFPYIAFERAFLQMLDGLNAKDVTGRGAVDDAKRELAAVEGKLEATGRKLEQVNERARREDDFSPYLDLMKRLSDDKKALAARLEELKAQAQVDRPDSLCEARSLIGLLDGAEGEERQQLRRRVKARIRELVREVWVLVEKFGRVPVAHVQAYLNGGGVQYFTVHTPADADPPPLRSYRNVDLREFRHRAA